MTVLVDFLPAAYRDRQLRARAARKRLLFAIPILAAVVATDLAFRMRIAGMRNRLDVARQDADLAAHRAFQADVATQRERALRAELEQLSAPLERPGVAAILDDLLADRPAGVHFHELRCDTHPCIADGVPQLRIEASCGDPDVFASFLRDVAKSAIVPPLLVEGTGRRAETGQPSFRLESAKERKK